MEGEGEKVEKRYPKMMMPSAIVKAVYARLGVIVFEWAAREVTVSTVMSSTSSKVSGTKTIITATAAAAAKAVVVTLAAALMTAMTRTFRMI